MFDALSDRFEAVFKKLKGRGTLTEKNMNDALRDVRRALLEADVHLNVVKTFIIQVKKKAIGRAIVASVTPGQQMIHVVHETLVELMGQKNSRLNLATQPPAVVMMVGLQGSGKTTTTAKLSKWLKEKERKKCLLASLDVYRPAAMEQLASVGQQVEVETLPIIADQTPLEIALRALERARIGGFDVLFLDTAGRLHIHEALMTELQQVRDAVKPVEMLLVADAMTGQDAVAVAQGFHEQLDITGVVLSKTDGDARGGAALSIRHVTSRPIKFLGTGEALDKLEPFYPDRLASRILGMGDVLTLVETAMEKVDLLEAAKLQKKIQKTSFTLEDFLAQMGQIKKMGSVGELVGMIPGAKQALKGQAAEAGEAQLKKTEAIILSMTHKERRKHALLNASRKRRIARGSGTTVQEINQMLKQFAQMQTIMKRMSKMGQKGMMPGGGGGGGGLLEMLGMPKMPGRPF